MLKMLTSASVIWMVLAVTPAHSGEKLTIIDVCHPTVIAFFAPPENAEELDGGYSEALSDFEFYNGQVQGPLKERGVALKVVYTKVFRTKCGTKSVKFAAGNPDVGYYFVAPGKDPHVQYGVSSDIGLLQDADQYFKR